MHSIKKGVFTAVVAGLTITGAGVAAAASGATPGDIFHGLDTALEKIGIGNGGAAERLEEARALLETGQVQDGLARAADGLERAVAASAGASAISSESGSAQDALSAAADRLTDVTTPDESIAAIRAQVAALLDYLAGQVGTPEGVDGAVVAEHAQAIGEAASEHAANASQGENDPPVDPGTPQGPPSSVPATPPVTVPEHP